MGGRIASQVAAQDAGSPAQSSSFAIRGLVFLGYPLHPPGHPEQRRTAHWPAVRVPALFVAGTRDPFAAPEELREELPRYAGETSVFVVVDGDHSLKVPRRVGRTQEEVIAEVQDAIARWVSMH
jgi:predicted alpha/beta-hydrolase family hydrolase